jgi:hypothetical protein
MGVTFLLWSDVTMMQPINFFSAHGRIWLKLICLSLGLLVFLGTSSSSGFSCLNNVPPFAEVIRPVNNQIYYGVQQLGDGTCYMQGEPIVLEALAYDPDWTGEGNGIETYEWRFKNESLFFQQNNAEIYAIYCGKHTFTLTVQDKGGAQTQRVVNFEVVEGTEPPKPATLDPLPGYININTITITGSAETGSIVTITNTTTGEVFTTYTNYDGTFEISVTLAPNQPNTFTVVIERDGGQTSTATVVASVQDSIDPTAPQIDLSITRLDGTFTITGVAGSTEGSNPIHIENVTNSMDSYITSNPDGSFHTAFPGFPGDTIEVSQIDLAGNEGHPVVVTVPDLHYPDSLYIYGVSGNHQFDYVGETLHEPFVVGAVDKNDVPQPDIPIKFTVVNGDGHLDQTIVYTNSNGEAELTFQVGTTPGINLVQAEPWERLPPQVEHSDVPLEFYSYGITTPGIYGTIEYIGLEADKVDFLKEYGIDRLVPDGIADGTIHIDVHSDVSGETIKIQPEAVTGIKDENHDFIDDCDQVPQGQSCTPFIRFDAFSDDYALGVTTNSVGSSLLNSVDTGNNRGVDPVSFQDQQDFYLFSPNIAVAPYYNVYDQGRILETELVFTDQHHLENDVTIPLVINYEPTPPRIKLDLIYTGLAGDRVNFVLANAANHLQPDGIADGVFKTHIYSTENDTFSVQFIEMDNTHYGFHYDTIHTPLSNILGVARTLSGGPLLNHAGDVCQNRGMAPILINTTDTFYLFGVNKSLSGFQTLFDDGNEFVISYFIAMNGKTYRIEKNTVLRPSAPPLGVSASVVYKGLQFDKVNANTANTTKRLLADGTNDATFNVKLQVGTGKTAIIGDVYLEGQNDAIHFAAGPAFNSYVLGLSPLPYTSYLFNSSIDTVNDRGIPPIPVTTAKGFKMFAVKATSALPSIFEFGKNFVISLLLTIDDVAYRLNVPLLIQNQMTTFPCLTQWGIDGSPATLNYYLLASGYSKNIEGTISGVATQDIEDIAVAADGTIYFLNNAGTSKLYKIDPLQIDKNPATPVVATYLGDTGLSAGDTDLVNEISAIDFINGSLYGLGRVSKKLYRINSSNGAVTEAATLNQSTTFRTDALTWASDGKVYLTKTLDFNSEVWRFDSFPSGNVSKVMTIGGSTKILGLSAHPNGRLYAEDPLKWFRINPISQITATLFNQATTLEGVDFYYETEQDDCQGSGVPDTEIQLTCDLLGGEVSINPNNSSDNEFTLTKADGIVFTRDDLKNGTVDSSGTYYAGQARNFRVKPKGNGNQNGLLVNGSPYPMLNANTYLISGLMGQNLTVRVYNDHFKNGKAMGHWWITTSGTCGAVTMPTE